MNLYLEKVASMYERAKYHDKMDKILNAEERVSSIKYDGANFFLRYEADGSPRFISRRPSVTGAQIERTEKVPHLATKLPSQAGKVYNVELIHTGHDHNAVESHPKVSGLLNSLPPKAIADQEREGPIRAVVFDMVEPKVPTYREKIEHMKSLVSDFGNSTLLFTPHFEYGEDGMERLIQHTKKTGREGIITLDPTKDESKNPRIKLKHVNHYNLRVKAILQEKDKHGNPKPSAGALVLEDATGREVGNVGTGFDHATRKHIHENPNEWLNKLIQVKAMKPTAHKLRQPVYNGEADGEPDKV